MSDIGRRPDSPIAAGRTQRVAPEHSQATEVRIVTGLVVALIFFFLLALFQLSPESSQETTENDFILIVLNTTLIGLIPIAAALTGASVYWRFHSPSALLLGAGMLTFGLANICAAFLRGLPAGGNLTPTVHNIGALISGAFIFFGTQRLMLEDPFQIQRHRGLTITALYSGVAVAIVLVVTLAIIGAMPVFFVPGLGPTSIRQEVLVSATLLYILSSLLLWTLWARGASRILLYYFLFVGMTALERNPISLAHTRRL